jgi:Lon protease-like protein
VILVGLCRFRVDEVRKKTPFLVAKITQLDYLSSMMEFGWSGGGE